MGNPMERRKTDEGMRLHVRFKHRKGIRKELDYESASGHINVYDVGIEELEALAGKFPDAEIVSFGRFAGTDQEQEAREIVG